MKRLCLSIVFLASILTMSISSSFAAVVPVAGIGTGENAGNLLFTYDLGMNGSVVACNASASGAVATNACPNGGTYSGTTNQCEYAPIAATVVNNYPGCDTPDITVGTYTIAACNVGASVAGTGADSYGKYFQWGNNGGTFSGNITPTTTLVDASANGPGNYYNSTTFIGGASLATPFDWTSLQNDNLWGDTTNTPTARQGPCASGYHIPSQPEWAGIVTTGGWGANGTAMSNTLKLPFAGYRNFVNGIVVVQGTYGDYWSSSPFSTRSYFMYFTSNTVIDPGSVNYRISAYPVRCIKNPSATPATTTTSCPLDYTPSGTSCVRPSYAPTTSYICPASTIHLVGSDSVTIDTYAWTFAGAFWIHNAGWATFDGLGADTAKLQTTANPDILSMTGFAWSQNAGWISFAPRSLVDTTSFTGSDVFLDRVTGLFHGFAWSQNLGWINIEDYIKGLPASDSVTINTGSGRVFAGSFWIDAAGWASFNSVGTGVARLQGTIDPNIMSMTGFAWSENAGWISFAPRSIIDAISFTGSDVFLDMSTGLFHGFAWNDNLGWLNMEGVTTTISAPSIANFNTFSADGAKVFTMTGAAPASIPPGTSYEFVVENWDSTATTTYLSQTPTFTHDFRKAKQYYIRITDPFGNSAYGVVDVVADVPADTLNLTHQITGAIPGTYTGTLNESRVADSVAFHSLGMKLRDQYGNPVINVPGVKDVHVRVAFNNNVDRNQFDVTLGGNLGLGDAIQFPANTFGGLLYTSGSVGTDSNTSGDYALDISSYAPTKAGYIFTTAGNDISLQKFSYEVTATGGHVGVGEVPETDKAGTVGTGNIRFSPALFLGSVINSDNWTIAQGYDTNFTVDILTGTTLALTGSQVRHTLDIDGNAVISYQNPVVMSGGTEICNGYNQTIATFQPGVYNAPNTLCNRPFSSNILMTSSPLASTMKFSWKPTIIFASPLSSIVQYTSEISYTNPVGNIDIQYPSYSRSNDMALSSTGSVLSGNNVGGGIINQAVVIFGMASGNNIFNTLSGTTANQIGSLTRVDIKNTIHQNVANMTRGGVPTTANYELHTGTYTLPSVWPAGKDTIIVDGGDLVIDSNILTGPNIKGIIVLKDAVTGSGGSIYIGKNVSNIAAVLYADKSIISGELTPTPLYYTDAPPGSQTATGQLFLEGTVISDNTIGGASMIPLRCPYGAGVCTSQEAKRYDLNYFRLYTGTGTMSPGASNPAVPVGSETYPFVTKYDTRLQTAPPPGFAIP